MILFIIVFIANYHPARTHVKDVLSRLLTKSIKTLHKAVEENAPFQKTFVSFVVERHAVVVI